MKANICMRLDHRRAVVGSAYCMEPDSEGLGCGDTEREARDARKIRVVCRQKGDAFALHHCDNEQVINHQSLSPEGEARSRSISCSGVRWGLDAHSLPPIGITRIVKGYGPILFVTLARGMRYPGGKEVRPSHTIDGYITEWP